MKKLYLAEKMRILMADMRQKKIQDISIGDLVLNEQGNFTSVSNIWTGIEANIYSMSLANGIVLKASKELPVMTEEGLKPMKDLQIGDTVKSLEGMQTIISIDEIVYNEKVYNLTLDSDSHLMICEGVIVAQQTL